MEGGISKFLRECVCFKLWLMLNTKQKHIMCLLCSKCENHINWSSGEKNSSFPRLHVLTEECTEDIKPAFSRSHSNCLEKFKFNSSTIIVYYFDTRNKLFNWYLWHILTYSTVSPTLTSLLLKLKNNDM